MAPRALALALLATAAALAGCSDGAPSGDFAADAYDIPLDGEVTATYTEASGQNAAGQVPELGPMLECAHDDDPTGTVPPCEPAKSEYQVHFMTLPELLPEAGAYHAWLLAPDAAVDMGELVQANGMWELRKAYEGDLSGAQGIELRLGSLAVATAPATAGKQDFTLVGSLTEVRASGSYDGKELTLTLENLPVGATYEAWLVTVDEAGAKTHVESFTVQEGANVVEAGSDVGDYQEVHVHVKGSKINVAIAAL